MSVVGFCRVILSRFTSFAMVCCVLTLATALTPARLAHAAEEAIAAAGPPLRIALFVNPTPMLCYNDGYVEATRKLAAVAVERINRLGGIRGRPIALDIYDNENSDDKAITNVRQALATKDLLALIGLSEESRAKKVFEIVAQWPDGPKTPFITNISVGETLKAHRNVFSTQPAQEVERVPVMIEFMKSNGAKTISFIGRTGEPWVETIAKGLRQQIADKALDIRMPADQMIDVKGNGATEGLDPAQLEAAIAAIEQDPPDLLVVSVGTTLTDDLLRRLSKSKVQPPVFMVGYLAPDLIDPEKPYPGAVYGIDWATVPDVESDRLFNILGQGEPQDWFFAGRDTATTADWIKNECSTYYTNYVPSTFSDANIAAAKEGARFADMIQLIATSAASTGSTLDIGGTRSGNTLPIQIYRAAILRDLGSKYAAGRGALKGIFENWSFHPIERVRAQTPTIVILPTGLGRKQLAQEQYVRLRNGGLKPISTVYLDIDLIRTYSVDNNQKSFFAEFYLAIRKNDNISIKDITFTNAFLDPRASRDDLTNGREISIDILNAGEKSDAYPPSMQMYKIAGRFRFTPDFSQYPFDTQQFSIDLQPRNSDKTFIIQPPPSKLRDTTVASEGWLPNRQYVSFVEDFVPMVDAFTHEPSIVPFYNARFVWQMERETTDYYIRVIVPLMFILIVAYLSIFIPKNHMEAIVTIQVTALLSAVALYLSLPQIDTDTATISDKIFMFDYMMVSLMIVISILRINARIVKMPWINGLLAFTHIVIVPAVLLGLVLYITKSDMLNGFAKLPGWRLLGLG